MENILFIDIETVPQAPNYNELNERWKKLWNHKASRLAKNDETPEELYPRAGIYAEFGKVVCVSAGILVHLGNKREFRVKSFFGENEHELLSEFCDLLSEKFDTKSNFLCAHNGKEFDFPYLCRRILANNIPMPDILDLAGKKPWDVQHLDTMQLWKFGDFKNYTSLDLLAAVFDIPTPKDDIDGSMIGHVFYQDRDLERIRTYCQKDVATLASIFLRMNGEKSLVENEINIV
jgi:uncharacterized protein YprB with RNaseH-like and TPR domain